MITRHLIRNALPIVKLGDVVDFLDHKRKPITASDRIAGPYPYYGANGQQDSINNYLFDEPLILLAEDGGHFDEPDRGIAYRISGKSWVNNHVHVLRARKCLDLGYLRRVLENYDVRPYISGTTRAKLTKAQAEKIEIPLPTKEVQQRVAAILDQADALRVASANMLKSLDAFSRSSAKSIFSQTFNGEVGFAPLGQLCDVRDGTHDSPKYVEEGYPLLTSKNFSNGYLDDVSAKKISQADYEKINARSRVDRGDIVMPMIGTIGSPVIIDVDPSFAIKNVALIKMKHSSLTSDYVREMLDSDLFKRHVANRGRGGTQKFVSLGDIREFLIPVPSASMLAQHGQLIERSRAMRSHLTVRKSKFTDLFFSLQHRAFNGEL